jgi:Domain of unknown function (DUF4214)
MNKLQLVFTASLLAAAGSLQAAGSIKTYVAEAAFGTDDVVDWNGLGATPAGGAGVSVGHTFGATSATGNVVATGSLAMGTLLRTERASGGQMLSTSANSGPLTIVFPSGPVMGVGMAIEPNAPGGFSGRLSVYDAAGNLLGTAAAGSRETAPTFIGIRSSARNISRVDFEAAGAAGVAIGGLRLALKPAFENDAVFVNQLFQDLYGRAPATSELAGYVEALKQGASSRARMAATLFESAPFHDNAAFLVKLFLAVQHRDPEFAQWAQILKLMQGGATQDDALGAFLNTAEHAAAYPPAMTNDAMVARLFQQMLERAPEAAEFEGWTTKLSQGVSRRELVEAFLRTTEFELHIAPRVDATLVYLAFLRRAGDPADIARLVNEIKTGATLTDVVDSILLLPEYVARY